MRKKNTRPATRSGEVFQSLSDYIEEEKQRDPGICILTYPYSFVWERVTDGAVREAWESYRVSSNVFAYVHVPFCSRECYFCGFYKLTGQPYSLIKAYLGNLQTEIEVAGTLLQKRRVLAVTIGGGTPSLLRPRDLAALLRDLTKKLNLATTCEVTVEVYPDRAATREKFAAMKEAGANRVSLGFQSLNDEIKRDCNRCDTIEQNLAAHHCARDVGFEEISIDLLCGLPQQTPEIWQDTVRRTIDLKPDQICFFPLSIRHPGIPFYEKMKQKLPSFETLKAMYFWAQGELITAGFQQVTRHNFKKPYHRGLYEYHQSLGTPCLGLGTNSISFLPGYIYKNVKGLDAYQQAVRAGELPVESGFDLVKHHEDANAFVIKRLTYLKVDKTEFQRRFGISFDETYPEQIEALASARLATNGVNTFQLTELGTYYTALAKRCFFSRRMHQLQTERLGRLKAPSRETPAR